MTPDQSITVRRRIARMQSAAEKIDIAVGRLERQCESPRRSPVALSICFAIVVTIFLFAAAPPRAQYKASSSVARAPFRIVDSKRKTLLLVKEEGDGSPRGMYLFGSEGKP